MDKYQKFILEQAFQLNKDLRYSRPINVTKTLATVRDCGNYHYQIKGFISEKTDRQDCGVFDFEHNTITIVQDADIYSTRYKHTFSDHYHESLSKDSNRGRAALGESGETFIVTYLKGVSVTKDGVTWEALPNNETSEDSNYAQYELVLDFSDRISSVKFSFVNNLADDYVMDVMYVEADKEEYNRKKVADERLRLIKAAAVECKTGAEWVNIYFAPCTDDYGHTMIVLYKGDRTLAKYDVAQDQFHLTINDLAWGDYTFVLTQFAKDGSLILETDHLSFRIVKPHRGRPSM